MNSEMESPFHRPVDVSWVREARQVRLTASKDERRAIASHLGLQSVASLTALLDIRPWRRHGLGVEGELTATIGQLCTVTAEPMQTEIAEPFDERLYPEDRDENRRRGEAVIDVEATDDYETFAGDVVDLGALVVEYLSLAIDPYPRRPGAVVEGAGPDHESPKTEDAPPASPFAGLAGHFATGANEGAGKDTGRAGGQAGKADDKK